MTKGITLAVIPARGGSKRLKHKNVMPLLNQPLLYYALKAAEKAALVTATLVSTDTLGIRREAERLGGLVCFDRPRELATDTASNYDVLRHAVEWWEDHRGSVEIAVLLQPTSPLRTSNDIDSAIRLLLRTRADAVFSVTPASMPPEWMVRLDARHRPHRILDPQERFKTRKQDLAPAYQPNGAVYVLRREHLRRRLTAYDGNSRCYVMPPERSVDIDEEYHLRIAEALLRSARRRRE